MVYLTPNPFPQGEGLQLSSAMPFSNILDFNRSLVKKNYAQGARIYDLRSFLKPGLC